MTTLPDMVDGIQGSLMAGDAAAALIKVQAALYETPGNAVLYMLAGIALEAQHRLEEAISAHRTALSLDPTLPEAHINLGNCLRGLGEVEAAMAHYAEVTDGPHVTLVRTNTASALCQLGRQDEAKDLLRQLPDSYAERNMMLGLLLLADGDYAGGWPLYRRKRHYPSDYGPQVRPRPAGLDDITGTRVLVMHEQGYGDSLQFIRYVALLADLAQVTLVVPPPLMRLFDQFDRRVATLAARPAPESYDVECFLLDLPWYFGTTVATIPADLPYLRVPHAAVVERRLRATRKPRVGLVWAGGQRPEPMLRAIDRRRSLRLDQLADLADFNQEIEFISLQMGEPAGQIAGSPIAILTPLKTGFDWLDTAAIIQQLDLVISVDTATAHLAGALGKPVWMLSRHEGCWRWTKGCEATPWYPDVMRIFWQETPGDWTVPVQRLCTALVSLLG